MSIPRNISPYTPAGVIDRQFQALMVDYTSRCAQVLYHFMLQRENPSTLNREALRVSVVRQASMCAKIYREHGVQAPSSMLQSL